MKELIETLAGWRRDGVAVGRAVVVRTFGSAPRPPGAVLIAASDGRIAGSVSGGCVEGAAAEEIANARASGRARVVRYGISHEVAWDVGLACGGAIDVLVEPFVPVEAEGAARESAAPVGSSVSRGKAVITPLPADSPGPEPGPHSPGAGRPPAAVLVASADGTLAGSSGDPATDAALVDAAVDALLRRSASRTIELSGRSYFVEVFPRPLRVVVVGAVQIAIPLVSIARTMGYETVVVDGRAAFATRERFPDAGRIEVAWLDEVADAIGLGPTDAVAVLAHDPKLDEPAIVEAFRRGCRYVGAIGSRKTQQDRKARLEAAGVSKPDLERLRGPIGLDLGGQSPEEIALAIMAEIVAARYGAGGGPKRDSAAPARGRTAVEPIAQVAPVATRDRD